MRTFDRVPQFDDKSRQFRAVAGIEDEPLVSKTWRCSCWNDQGYEGACVGFAWSHELCAQPKKFPVDAEFARAIYYRAKQIDYWYGEDYEGTSVLAGVKAVKEVFGERGLPLIQEYRWAFGLEDVVRTIGHKGPVVFGLNWYQNMTETTEKGWIEPTGGLYGGHAICGRGVRLVRVDKEGPWNMENIDIDKSYVVMRNSWSQWWGVNGDCKITLRNLDYLLNEDGEACIPVKRSV